MYLKYCYLKNVELYDKSEITINTLLLLFKSTVFNMLIFYILHVNFIKFYKQINSAILEVYYIL